MPPTSVACAISSSAPCQLIDASAKTADDTSAFVEHIRADIAAWVELCSKQDKAKAAKEEEKKQHQKSGTGGKSLIKIFAGKK